MNTEEVAKKVVELVRKQAWHEALDTLYDKNIVSVEARASDGESAEKRGIDQNSCRALGIRDYSGTRQPYRFCYSIGSNRRSRRRKAVAWQAFTPLQVMS